MTNRLALMLTNDGTSASATRHGRQYRMRRRPLGAQSDAIGTAAVAKRHQIASRAVLSHAQPGWRGLYGESQLRIIMNPEVSSVICPLSCATLLERAIDVCPGSPGEFITVEDDSTGDTDTT